MENNRAKVAVVIGGPVGQNVVPTYDMYYKYWTMSGRLEKWGGFCIVPGCNTRITRGCIDVTASKSGITFIIRSMQLRWICR